MDIDILKGVVTDVLKSTPYRPFLCLPMSATLYAILKDIHKIEAQLITGNLIYNNQYIFKQDFSVNRSENNSFQSWAGHAWVQVDDLICDLSFFRTLYSPEFTKPFKSILIDRFGTGRGSLIGPIHSIPLLTYQPVDTLEDDIATRIIRGFETLLDNKSPKKA